MSSHFPNHPVLAAVAANIERVRWWATLMDKDMNLVWISPELGTFFGSDFERLYGRHFLEFTQSDEILSKSSRRSVMRSGLDFLPLFIDRTPGGRETVRAIMTSLFDAEIAGIVDHVPDHQDPVWMTSFKWTPGEGMAPLVMTGLCVDIYDRDADFIGVANIFLAPLPSRLVALLARGDEASLERMARLTNPGRRSAAILFADVQSSGLLSRRLPSAVYFRLVRTTIAAIDQVVVSNQGIVGRHAGDGVTAFFLADDLGTPSEAARAAISAARSIRDTVLSVAAELESETDGLIAAKALVVNVGLHWGSSLYMGQLVTGGRLEVTALGDAVNECARIQETARDGEMLVSKTLLENLDEQAANQLRIDTDSLVYRSIAETAHASEKAVRDAGGIAVSSL